jgi:hypothetical protein
MSKEAGITKDTADRLIKGVRRKTRKHFSGRGDQTCCGKLGQGRDHTESMLKLRRGHQTKKPLFCPKLSDGELSDTKYMYLRTEFVFSYSNHHCESLRRCETPKDLSNK